MTNNANIEFKLAYDYPKEVEELFSEYTKMLIDGDEKFKKYLEIQKAVLYI